MPLAKTANEKGVGLGRSLARLKERLSAGETASLANGAWLYRLADATQPAAAARFVQDTAAAEPMLLIAHPAEAQDWLPNLSRRASRFCRRAWREPATIFFPHDGEEGLTGRLPAPLRQWIAARQSLGLHLSGSVELLELLQEVDVPLLAAMEETPTEGETEAVPPPRQYRWRDGQPHAAVGEALPDETRHELTACEILFVCTGNTCRSPMAEAIFKKLLAERLGCGPGDLSARGWRIRSAGIGAALGHPASEGAQQVAAQRSLCLAAHQSQPVTLGLLSEADHIYTMTAGHWRALAGRLLFADSVLELLAPDGFDIMDPYGAEQASYDACAQMLEEQLARRLADFADELPPAAGASASTHAAENAPEGSS